MFQKSENDFGASSFSTVALSHFSARTIFCSIHYALFYTLTIIVLFYSSLQFLIRIPKHQAYDKIILMMYSAHFSLFGK